jgi:addiction module RelE/StbE family toxin
MQALFSKEFRKKYQKLQKSVQQSFNERLEIFLTNPLYPLLHDHSLTGEWEGCRSINVTGSYRAIYRQEGELTVRFLAIGIHPELYGS